MVRLRRYRGVMAVAAVSLYAGVGTLGAFRGCWGSEHAHAGAAAPDCVEHHQMSAHSLQHSHHDHDGAGQGGDARMTCRCSSDSTTPYVGPNAIIVRPPAIIPVMQIATLPAEGRPVHPDAQGPPPAPPPRRAVLL